MLLEDKVKRLEAEVEDLRKRLLEKEEECDVLDSINHKILSKWRITDAVYKEMKRRCEYLQAIINSDM